MWGFFLSVRTDVVLCSQLSIVIGISHGDYFGKNPQGTVKLHSNHEDAVNRVIEEGKSYGPTNLIMYVYRLLILAKMESWGLDWPYQNKQTNKAIYGLFFWEKQWSSEQSPLLSFTALSDLNCWQQEGNREILVGFLSWEDRAESHPKIESTKGSLPKLYRVLVSVWIWEQNEKAREELKGIFCCLTQAWNIVNLRYLLMPTGNFIICRKLDGKFRGFCLSFVALFAWH